MQWVFCSDLFLVSHFLQLVKFRRAFFSLTVFLVRGFFRSRFLLSHFFLRCIYIKDKVNCLESL